MINCSRSTIIGINCESVRLLCLRRQLIASASLRDQLTGLTFLLIDVDYCLGRHELNSITVVESPAGFDHHHPRLLGALIEICEGPGCGTSFTSSPKTYFIMS